LLLTVGGETTAGGYLLFSARRVLSHNASRSVKLIEIEYRMRIGTRRLGFNGVERRKTLRRISLSIREEVDPRSHSRIERGRFHRKSQVTTRRLQQAMWIGSRFMLMQAKLVYYPV
jgi:hypothetical protein